MVFSFFNSCSGLKVWLAVRSPLILEAWAAGHIEEATRRKQTRMGMIGEILDQLQAMPEKFSCFVAFVESICCCRCCVRC